MIPKTLHYIWFGGNALGPKEEACIASWSKYCQDYDVVRWDETNFDVSANQYCKEAYDAKKWAFVSDYARLWILVNYGGIYLDTDVEIVKPLDCFLKHEAFSGFESDGGIPTGLMACEKGFPLFEALLADYDNRHFLNTDGTVDLTTNVTAITNACLKRGFVPNGHYQVVDGFALYPKDWFCPKSYDTGFINMTSNTYAIHHFSGSWESESTKEISKLKHEILRRHPDMNSKVAAAIAKLSYGFRSKDFEPFIDSFRHNNSLRQGQRK